MRCQAKIKIWITEYVFITEPNDDGFIIPIRVKRITWCMQQCPVTTRQKSARCWKELGMCGRHAAETNPLFYPKAKGHRTGGRHGLDKPITNAISLMEVPLIEVKPKRHDSKF